MATNLHRVKIATNPNYKRSGTKSYVYLLRKWGFNPTQEGPYHVGSQFHQQGRFGSNVGGKMRQQQVLKKKDPTTGQTGEVSAEDQQNDSLYLAKVQIGTPPQTFDLDFDTGSADLWVWSTSLPASVRSSGTSHNIFDPRKSSTFKKTPGSTWKISYGDQSSASGSVGTDLVSIGGLKIENQTIELATTLSTEFQSGSGDGLLGLAFGNINTVQPTPAQTPVENMISQSDIPSSAELFTAKLGSWRDAADADKGESFYTFGFIDQPTLAAAGASISYTPVDSSQGFWQFSSAAASINGKTLRRPANTAIADTGTTLALVDDTTCKAIYAAIPGAKYDAPSQGYLFPANTPEADLPTVAFAVGDKLFAVQKEDLGFADAGNGMLYGGIQSRGDMTMDILGDTFLKGIYAIFDQGNSRFGAVQRQELVQNLAPPPPATE